jgi:hypothetical protein
MYSVVLLIVGGLDVDDQCWIFGHTYVGRTAYSSASGFQTEILIFLFKSLMMSLKQDQILLLLPMDPEQATFCNLLPVMQFPLILIFWGQSDDFYHF